jgi:hypothetical protein
MRTQSRLQTISTAISLFGMAMGFSALGFMIVVNQHDGGASIAGGILGILLGATFLMAACLHLTRCGQIQGGFRQREFQQSNSLLKCDKLPMQPIASDPEMMFGGFYEPRAFDILKPF